MGAGQRGRDDGAAGGAAHGLQAEPGDLHEADAGTHEAVEGARGQAGALPGRSAVLRGDSGGGREDTRHGAAGPAALRASAVVAKDDGEAFEKGEVPRLHRGLGADEDLCHGRAPGQAGGSGEGTGEAGGGVREGGRSSERMRTCGCVRRCR